MIVLAKGRAWRPRVTAHAEVEKTASAEVADKVGRDHGRARIMRTDRAQLASSSAWCAAYARSSRSSAGLTRIVNVTVRSEVLAGRPRLTAGRLVFPTLASLAFAFGPVVQGEGVQADAL